MDQWTITYLSALIVGGTVVLLSLLSGDSDADTSSAEISEGFQLLSLLPLRALFYFACFFGLSGLLGRLLLDGPLHQATALTVGALCAWTATKTLGRLGTRSYSSGHSEEELAGVLGTVTVPIGPGAKGKISGTLKGRTVELLAQLPGAADRLDAGAKVMILEVQQGVALVEPEQVFQDRPAN